MEDANLNSLEKRYPGETAVLGRVFGRTTNSYKLYWMKAILSILDQGGRAEIPIQELLREMVAIAWHTVTFFRLSLGRQDMLQEVVATIRNQTSLEPQADLVTIRETLMSNPGFDAEIAKIGEYVPERFLTPWFSSDLRGMPDWKKNAAIVSLAAERAEVEPPPMYHFAVRGGARVILIDASWRNFLGENAAIVHGFVHFHLVHYLQRRNPSTPGIIGKLSLPPTRDLSYARRYWSSVRARLADDGESQVFGDIYSGEALGDEFSIDHFIPWSFVMHDLIWDLAPVAVSTNSRKGDRVPSLERYLAPLAKLHHRTLRYAKSNRTISDMYIECFREEIEPLAAMDSSSFRCRLEDVLLPLAKVAGNQGFETGWVLHSAG